MNGTDAIISAVPRATSRFGCTDCGADTRAAGERYMVHDEVWATALGRSDAYFLCVGCVERRLGRELCADDFTLAPLSYPVRWIDGAENAFAQSERLQDRLWRTAR